MVDSKKLNVSKVLLGSLTFFLGISLFSNFNANTGEYLRRLETLSKTIEQGNDSSIDTKRRTQALSPAIVTLVTPLTNLDDLCATLRTLENAEGSTTAPLLIFHVEETPSLENQEYLNSCTDRSVHYPLIGMDDFPQGFEPVDGVDYTRAKINRFWTTGIWNHIAASPYDVIMRIENDACFSRSSAHLPDFSKSTHNYHSQYFAGTVDLNPFRLQGMYEFAVNYMKQNNLLPAYTELWQKVLFTNSKTGSIPNFQDSYEIARKSFMTREDVAAWHYALTELPPYGYFTQGWNVHAERFLTASIFGTKSSVDHSYVPGFVQKNLGQDIRYHEICTRPFTSSQ
mmetsp:Transcript_2114/g.2982  ORF Transcript_2114/g.2982 Transcript_2114/m.2982 type:complete len:341 (-) Transcript_2114:33-1055(-)